MREEDNIRLQRQATDAAQRLSRRTGEATIVAVVHDIEGGMGVAFAVEGPRLSQIELTLLMMLRRLEEDLMPGAASGCEDCSHAYARVSAAVAALAPGFSAGANVKGRC